MALRFGWVMAVLLLVTAPAAAETRQLKDFFGTFEGEGETLNEAGVPRAPDRVSGVEISAEGDGFRLRWTTMMMGEGPDGSTDARVKTSEQVFARVAEDSWREVRNDMPGNGRPFAWARLDGDTLIVTALILRNSGSYDVTSYERRLVTPDTMEVRFTRFKDGEITRRVKAELKRKAS